MEATQIMNEKKSRESVPVSLISKSVIQKVSEWIALFAVMNFCIACFLLATSFGFIIQRTTYWNVTFWTLVVIGSIRLLIGTILALRDPEKRKSVVICRMTIALLTIVPCKILNDRYGYDILLFLPFSAFCLYGINAKKVIKVFSACLGLILIATVLSALSGGTENLLYQRGKGSQLRGSYGIGYPTDLAAYLVYLFLFAWVLWKGNGWKHSILFLILAAAIGYFIYTRTDSRNSEFCCIICMIAIVYELLDQSVLSKRKRLKTISRVGEYLTILSFPLMGIIYWILVWLYSARNEFAYQLDSLFSGRLSLTVLHLTKYGLFPFGTYTPQRGLGGALVQISDYEFLDSTYALLPIRYGWILTLLIMFIWIWMTYKVIKNGHKKMALAMSIICIHSFMEHHFIEANYNIFLLMPLCEFSTIKSPEPSKILANRKDRFHISPRIITYGITLCIFLLTLPRMLSWGRTILFMREFNNAQGKGWFALLSWLGLLFLLIILCINIIALFSKRKEVRKRSIYNGLFACIAVGVLIWGIISANTEIQKDGDKIESQLLAENDSIQTVLETAEEPVYGGPLEEIYKRRFNGFSDHIFSDLELAQGKRGTIILNNDNEGYQMIQTGALYTELSEYSGLFSYDSKLIEKMTNEGYQFNPFYSGRRNVNLASQAAMNPWLKMSDQGQMIINGDSLIHGPYQTEYKGRYQVSFSMRLSDEEKTTNDPEQEVCTLRVSNLHGMEVLEVRELKRTDFDADGYVNYTIDYDLVQNSDCIEYLVICREGVTILLDRISWKMTGII